MIGDVLNRVLLMLTELHEARVFRKIALRFFLRLKWPVHESHSLRHLRSICGKDLPCVVTFSNRRVLNVSSHCHYFILVFGVLRALYQGILRG